MSLFVEFGSFCMNLVLTCVLSEFVTHDIFVAACFLLLQSTCDSCCCLFLVFFCHMVLIQVIEIIDIKTFLLFCV